MTAVYSATRVAVDDVAEGQLLEYSIDADQLVYSKLRGRPGGVSHASHSSTSSYSSSNDESAPSPVSLRTTPRSPRGPTHRRLQIVDLAPADVALLVPNVAHAVGTKVRPTSCLPAGVSLSLPLPPGARRAHHARSRSDPHMPARSGSAQDDSASEYSDEVPQSDDASSSGAHSSRPGASPLTPADLHGSYLVGIASDDLARTIHGPNFLDYHPGIHSSSGPIPRLGSATGTDTPPRPVRPYRASPSPVASRRTSQDTPPSSRNSSDHASTTTASNTRAAALQSHDDDDPASAHTAASPTIVLDDVSPARTPLASPNSPGARTPSSVRSLHAREGAFPPSSFIHPRGLPSRSPVSPTTFSSGPAALEDLVQALDSDKDPDTPVSASAAMAQRTPSPPKLRRDKTLPKIVRDDSDESLPSLRSDARSLRRHSELPHRSNSSGLDVPSLASSSSSSLKRQSMNLHPTASGSRLSGTPSPSSSRDELPEIPQHERLRAFPRTPSSLSMASTSMITHIPTFDSTRTITGKRKRRGGKDIYPPTMLFQDIVKKKTPLDRGGAYTSRLHDLLDESSGLDEWVHFMRNKHKAPVTVEEPEVLQMPIRPPGVHAPMTRHASGASVSSEATFPIRPDSYVAVAVDLTPSDSDDMSPPTGPPALPYPGLANGPIRPAYNPASVRSLASSTVVNSTSSTVGKSSGGFFASITRKASLGKKFAGEGTGNRLISRRQPVAPPQPRPIHLAGPPGIPGGPRAPGPRRSNTVGGDMRRVLEPQAQPVSPLGARPIPSSPSSASGHGAPAPSAPMNDAFTRSLNGMVDLLPHVDRTTLGHYLRRAEGREINAISAYLSDEKTGRIERPAY